MRLTDSTIVRAPLEAVFDFYADPMGASIVEPSTTVTVITPGPLGVGTRAKIVGRKRTLFTELVAYDRPVLATFDMTSPGQPGSIRVDQRFTTVSDATRVDVTFDYRMPLIWNWFLTLFRPLQVRSTARASHRIARIAEAHIAASPGDAE